jgi:conjugative transfer pilus assembly protein TraH
MRKTFASMLLLGAMAAPAHALNIDEAFSSLTNGATASFNGGGHYSNAMRHNFVLGGASARIPSRKVTLLSVTPPTLNASCQGIDAHFGGFSFVSGAQIEQLISSIAANSTGMVVSLVLKTLCPLCQGVIEAMTHMAQAAAKASLDSCQVGSALLNSAGSLFGVDPNAHGDSAGTVCGRKVAGAGQYQDYLDAMTRACESVDKAVAKLEQLSEPPTNADGTKPVSGDKQTTDVGNRTWEALKAIGYGGTDSESFMARQLMLNLIGTRVVVSKDENGKPLEYPAVYPPLLTPDQVMDLYMCGTTEFNATDLAHGLSSANLICADQNRAGSQVSESTMVWSCKDDPDKCLYPKLVSVKDMGAFEGTGFLYRVTAMLLKAADDVRSGRAISDPNVLRLMEQVPYPVYQIINIAAVYPVAADDLIATSSAVIAESMAESTFEYFVRRAGGSVGKVWLSQEDVNRISQALQSFTATLPARQSLIANHIAVQEGMMENIRTLNLAIQKEALSSEMLGTSRFANSVTDSVAQTNR